MRLTRLATAAAAALAMQATTAWALISGPYAADANTAYLFHFSEAAGASVAANSGSAPGSLISFEGAPFSGDGFPQAGVTTILGGTGFTRFGNAANLAGTVTQGLGLDVDGDGNFLLDDNAPLSTDRLADHASMFGVGGAFTLEAMINIDAITGTNREIIATDSASGAADRGFQFRVNTTGALEFNFIGVNTSSVTVPIPTTGSHAFVANQWFHAAMSYDGANVQFYWTKVDPSFTSAAALGGPLAEGVDVNDDALLVIGNEGRVVGTTGSGEGIGGLIDEVRISTVARTATQFFFADPAPGDVNGDFQVNILDFNVITANFLNSGTTRAQGDLNNDGKTDYADFRIWKINKTSPAGTVTIPEPATAALTAAALGWLGMRRRAEATKSC